MSARHTFVRVLRGLLLLLLAFLLGALGMHFGMHAGQQQQIIDLRAQVDDLRTEASEAESRIARLQSDLDIELATRHTLETTLGGVQKELGDTRNQLAFYEQLIPPAAAGAVAIRAFDVRNEGGVLHYRVLLTRNAPDQAPFQGRLRFFASTQDQGKPAKIALSAATADPPGTGAPEDTGADPFALAFDQFQRSTGVLRIPADVAVHSVTVEVLEGDVVRATRQTDVQGIAPAGEPSTGAPE